MNKKNNHSIIYIIFAMILGSAGIFGQVYFKADPVDLVMMEFNSIKNSKHVTAFNLRPAFNYSAKDNFNIFYNGEFYYNNGAPNLENMSNKVVGKGFGSYHSINLAYRNNFIMASMEPYYYFNQNLKYNKPDRPEIFDHLVDNISHHDESPISDIGIKEFQLYLHWKGIGFGISNANMWWGPGIHNSIVMSNNAPGFNTLQIGTIEEVRINNWELLSRFIFSKLDNRNIYKPYFSGIYFGATYYSKPIITLGLTKSIIIGGDYPGSDQLEWYEAFFSVFRNSGNAGGDIGDFKENWSVDDNIVTFFISTIFPRSKLKIFFEIGKSDTFWDYFHLALVPDHAIATNIGFKKYVILNNKNIYFGLEHSKIITSRYLDRLSTGPWYNRPHYEYNSFGGRYYGAHSGPDSDDLFIYSGYQKNGLLFHLSLDFERHGLIVPYYEGSPINEKLIAPDNYYPELKIEYRATIEYEYIGYRIAFNFEHERVNNYEFKDNNKRTGTVFWVGIEKEINL